MIDYQQLERCPVFHGITGEEIKKILEGIYYQIKSFKSGEVIAMAGEPTRFLFIILSGSVRGEMMDFSGKTIKIEDIEAPNPLASAFLFGKRNFFPVNVTANSDGRILSISITEFLKLLQRNAVVLKNYLDTISSRSQFLSQKLRFLSFKTIREKIAHYLLQEAGGCLHSIVLKATQQQLADLFGVARPSLARVLGEMQREKLIVIEKKTVTLLDRSRLQKILSHG